MATTEFSYNQSYKQKGSRFATLFVLGGDSRGVRGIRGVRGATIGVIGVIGVIGIIGFIGFIGFALSYISYTPLYILSNSALKISRFSFLISNFFTIFVWK